MARCASRLARAIAAALLAASALVVAPSCTGVIGLDSFKAAPSSLCTKLTDCYADGAPSSCQSRIDGSLGAASAAQRSSWLASFSEDTCLESCAAARRCLDIQPVCSLRPSSCGSVEECCDFVKGLSDCVGGYCCSTRGVRCKDDNDCCSNAGYCDPPDPNHKDIKFCGAVVCRDSGIACTLDAQCCSKVCRGNACAPMICGDDGFDCAADADCCSGHCEPDGRCGRTCAPVGGVCHTSKDCCGGVPCFVPKGADSGFCSPCQGAPNGVHCATDADCCSGLICDRTFFECTMQCVAAGAACTNPGECCSGACTNGVCQSQCSNAYCTTDADCCSGTCLGATCLAKCVATTCDHDVCTEGAPIGGPCSQARDACVGAVCGVDMYCCCGAWDTLCIAEAATFPQLCGGCP